MNIISAVEGPDGRLFQSIWQALKQEFGEIRVYCVGDPETPEAVQNIMVLAFPEAPDYSRQYRGISNSPDADEVERLERNLYTRPIVPLVPPLRDEFAPVERYALMLTR